MTQQADGAKNLTKPVWLWFFAMLLLMNQIGCSSPMADPNASSPWYKESSPAAQGADKNQAGPQAAAQPAATDQARQSEAKSSQPGPATGSCQILRTKADLERCGKAAMQGDADAAYKLARAHSKGLLTPSVGHVLKPDHLTALVWYAKAYELGNNKALRYLFEAYYYGIKVKPDRKAAMGYLEHAARLKQQWAMMIKAAWSEDSDPQTAWNYYLKLAQAGNCHAQEKLAQFYMKHYVRRANYTMAYFWGLLANQAAFRQKSEYHKLAMRSSTGSSLCGHSKTMHQAKSLLSKDFALQAEQAAKLWKTGDPEPQLDAPAISQNAPKRVIKRKQKARSLKQKIADSPEFIAPGWKTLWEPVVLPNSAIYKAQIAPTEIFTLVNNSVWTVKAASTKQNLQRERALSLGSGVAVSINQIITNYHVVMGKPYIQVLRGKKKYNAQILYYHKPSDRCVLLVQGELEPVTGFRPYTSLKIGEQVYTVGSPKGLENTLGQGLISGLRRNKQNGMHLIQTNAQISQGSSGGGLFDRFGNLIGITTLKIKDAESLNFAISVDDYTK